MNKNQIIAAILLVTIVLAVPMCSAVSLSKPTVTLPSNWAVTDETNYPNTYAEHDPAGAGEITYEDSETYDFVMLYYENSVSSYSQTQLKSEAESIFHIYQANVTMTDSGVMTIAGVPAGFAKGYESQYNTYDLQIVMVKGNYYFNAYAGYDANSQSESRVMSLLNSINSINTGGSSIGGFIIWIVIGVVAVVIVIVVVVLLVRKRKKLSSPAMPGDLPPPPPLSV